MFLVIPIVEFLHVLGVDINVHHENPATFLCHVSISSVKQSRHRFASSRWHPVLAARARERHETPTGSHLSLDGNDRDATRKSIGVDARLGFHQLQPPRQDLARPPSDISETLYEAEPQGLG